MATSTLTDAARAVSARRAGRGTGQRARSRRPGLAPLGLLPFLGYVSLVFLAPVGFIAYNAFRRTVTLNSTERDPVTQQFVHKTQTSFTSANLSASLRGVYWKSLATSVELSAVVAVLGAVLGLVLAWAVVNTQRAGLSRLVSSAAAVTANFGGIPLAFLFIATLDANSGVLTTFLKHRFGFSLQDDAHIRLADSSGLAIVYLYFLIPLMVLVITPSLEGLKPQWAEAAENLGASRSRYWRHVAGPVLVPSFLGSVLLLFCSSFSAFATAYAINSSYPLVTIRIDAVLSGNVLSGEENLGAALALDMIVVVVPLTVAYQLLQRRTSRWLS